MADCRDILAERLPRFDPPQRTIPEPVIEEIGRARHREDALVVRSTRWTYAIHRALWLGPYKSDKGFPVRRGFGHPAIGCVTTSGFETFGIILYLEGAPAGRGDDTVLVDRLHFPELDATFEVFAVPGRRRRHAAPDIVAPWPATAACWGRDKLVPGAWGVVTAGHAIPRDIHRSAIGLSTGNESKLARSADPPVDAGFVLTVTGTACPDPSAARALRIDFPAAGLPVEVRTQTGSLPRQVKDVRMPPGLIFETFGIAATTELDHACAPGDSGALVATPQGEVVGIYSGEFTDPVTGQSICGLAQHFGQAEYCLDFEAYL